MFTHPASPPSIHVIVCLRVCPFIKVRDISFWAPWHLARPHPSTHFCLWWSLRSRRTIILRSASFRTVFSPSSTSVETRRRPTKLGSSSTQPASRPTTCWAARGVGTLWWTLTRSMTMAVSMRMYVVFSIIGLSLGWSTEDSPCFGDFYEAF